MLKMIETGKNDETIDTSDLLEEIEIARYQKRMYKQYNFQRK